MLPVVGIVSWGVTGSRVLASDEDFDRLSASEWTVLTLGVSLNFFLRCGEKAAVFGTRLGKDALFFPVSETVYSRFLAAFIHFFFPPVSFLLTRELKLGFGRVT